MTRNFDTNENDYFKFSSAPLRLCAFARKNKQMKTKSLYRLMTLYLSIASFNNALAQETSYSFYPKIYDSIPDIISPFSQNDSIESILIVTKNNQYGIVPVTVENGKPLLYSYKIGTVMGKDKQLQIDTGDFPSLAKTGLHNEMELYKKKMITGIPIDVINYTAKPNGYSNTGFLSEDEDIINVLIGDNRLVGKMKLTHAQLAKPLFHIWNLILKETELGNWARYYDNIKKIHYNDNILNFRASGSKGWQQSVFFDEIQGRYNIHIDRKLKHEEFQFLKSNYTSLTKDEFNEMVSELTSLDFSEMLPYYIMRYGFYEGHTDYRCNPVSIALIFGLKSIYEIEDIFRGKLYQTLIIHYTSNE
jgi:hypothetical protein